MLVDHALDYEKALETKDSWRKHMEAPSKRLEDYLGQLTGKYDFPCTVCQDKLMTRGACDHLSSQAHWRTLWTNLKRFQTLPPKDIAVQEQRPWIQAFDIPGGSVVFNHLTGGQRYAAGEGAGPPPAQAAAAPPHMAAAAAAPAGYPSPHQNHMPSAASPAGPSGPAPTNGGAASAPTDGEVKEVCAHSHEYATAMQSKDAWRTFMTVPGKITEDFLHAATGSWDHSCQICGKNMQRGAQDHMCSQAHYKLLWNVIGGSVPPWEVATRQDVPWVQQFPVRTGFFLVNHLTGGQMLVNQAPPPQAPQAQAEHRAVAPPQPVLPAAQGSYQDVRVVDPRVPVRNNTSYRDAVNSKEGWKLYMDEPANRLEKYLYVACPSFSGHCVVCDAPMNGVANHILSQKHWKKIWERIGGDLPPPQAVIRWDQAWVAAFNTAKGPYLFNHLTGEQALKSDLASVESPAPDSAAAPGAAAAPLAASSGAATMPVPAQMQQPPPRMQAPPPHLQQPPQQLQQPPPMPEHPQSSMHATVFSYAGGCDLDLYHWKCLVLRPAKQLNDILATSAPGSGGAGGADLWENPAGATYSCAVCEVDFARASEHFASHGHFRKLLGKVAELAETSEGRDPDEDTVCRGPWLQDFGPVVFNHLTLDVTPKTPAFQ